MATKKAATPKKSAPKASSKALTKAVFVELIAKEFEFPKSKAGEILDYVTETLKKSIKKSGSVSLSGLGTFRIAKRAARTGRNPATGATIKVKASKTVRFKPTPTFKSEL
jgi:DNA-binding protein HU-beta